MVMVLLMRNIDVRRNKPRYEFTAIQYIAPISDEELSAPPKFQPVRCRDISQDGFSFWVDAIPTYKKLIVMLRSATDGIQVYAEIVHVQVCCHLDRPRFLVGCRFLKRLAG